jgi:hypothetical protein
LRLRSSGTIALPWPVRKPVARRKTRDYEVLEDAIGLDQIQLSLTLLQLSLTLPAEAASNWRSI